MAREPDARSELVIIQNQRELTVCKDGRTLVAGSAEPYRMRTCKLRSYGMIIVAADRITDYL